MTIHASCFGDHDNGDEEEPQSQKQRKKAKEKKKQTKTRKTARRGLGFPGHGSWWELRTTSGMLG